MVVCLRVRRLNFGLSRLFEETHLVFECGGLIEFIELTDNQMAVK